MFEVDADKGSPAFVSEAQVSGIKQFLPAGPVAESEPSATDGIRKQNLVQLWTDRGKGFNATLRTVAVASIRLTKPKTAESQD